MGINERKGLLFAEMEKCQNQPSTIFHSPACHKKAECGEFVENSLEFGKI